MPRRNGKLPADRSGTECLYRIAAVDTAAANETERSLPVILATEQPVQVLDRTRMEVVDEVLRMDGMELPAHVPMVDSHDRSSVRNVLGSIRDLEINDDTQLVGRAYFSKDAADTFELYREGHLTDFSVGASVKQLEREDDGTRIVTRSKLVEGSAVVAGADPNAKATHAMRAYVDPHVLKEELMLDQFKAALVKRGMPENATEAETIAFVETLRTEPAEPVVTATVETTEPAVPEVVRTEEPAPVVVTATVDRSAVILGIDELCRAGNVPDDQRRAYMTDPDATEESVAMDILRNGGGGTGAVGLPPIESGKSEREKFYAAAEQSMLNRLADSGAVNPDKVLNRTDIADDAKRRNEELKLGVAKRETASDLNYVRLPDMARMFLERSGERVHGLPQHEIVRRAVAQREFVSRADGPASNTTGSFTNLMLDAANKTLLAGYDEAPYTYSQWVRQAPSASDFKTLNRIRFGEMADPEAIPENNPYPEKGTEDSKESYAVEKHGEIFSISLEAVINDDLNAMTRIPQMQGNAMRRKVNKVCYAILTANANLSDGVALFHATSHGANLDATALAEGALDTGYTVMMNQTGLSGSGTPIGLVPEFLIVPPDLAATAFRLTGGGVVPATVGNVPLYGTGGPRALTVVVEAQLTANSTTAWYLAAGSGAVETVEVTFLQGEESPVMSRMDGFETDTIKYKVRQTFNAKAIDYVGLYQGNG